MTLNPAAIRAQDFGGAHTELKLSVVTQYLESWAKALKNKSFNLSCVDAFAGSGWRRVEATAPDPSPDLFGEVHEQAAALPGSAVRFLRSAAQIDRYVFNDRSPVNFRSLQDTVAAERAANAKLPAAEVLNLGAAALIQRECQRLRDGRMCRALMFLDPFGLQLSHADMHKIADTQAADVWVLVPTGMALNRLAPRRGEPSPQFSKALNRFFGSDEWRTRFYAEKQADMWGGVAAHRVVSSQAISSYVLEWMGGIFGPGALPRGLSLRSPRTHAEDYLLVFACANRQPAAFKTAHKIANWLIDQAEGKDRKTRALSR